MIETAVDFATPALEETIQRVAEKIRERNIEVVIVDNGDEARHAVVERVPKGAEVHSGKSKTLQDAGIFDVIHEPGQYDALRPRFLKMDRQTQAREIRKLILESRDCLEQQARAVRDGLPPKGWDRLKQLYERVGRTLDLGALSEGARHSANRAGLLVAGGVAPRSPRCGRRRRSPPR